MNNERFEQILASSRRAVRAITATRLASQATLGEQVRGDQLTDEEIAAMSALFTPWTEGESVSVGDLREWKTTVVQCLQAHVTQAGWEPPVVPALWQVRGTLPSEGPPPAWVQPNTIRPDGFLQFAYSLGERVVHDRPQAGGADWIFESLIEANTTEPGRDGELDRWWQPVSAVV